jgi:hypothetical protein
MPENTSIPADFPMPPASFAFLVESILMQTQMQLGLLKLGQNDEEDMPPNLPLARHSIDMLGMLQEMPAPGEKVEKKDDRPLIITPDGGKGTKTE